MTDYFIAQLADDEPLIEAMCEVITRLNTAATEDDARAIAEMKRLWVAPDAVGPMN